MAEEFGSDSCSGYKRRSPETSAIEAAPLILEDSNSNTVASELLCSKSVSFAKEESENGLLKKVKCSSHSVFEEDVIAREEVQQYIDNAIGKNSSEDHLGQKEQCSVTLDSTETSATHGIQCVSEGMHIMEEGDADKGSGLSVNCNSTGCSLMVDAIDETALIESDCKMSDIEVASGLTVDGDSNTCSSRVGIIDETTVIEQYFGCKVEDGMRKQDDNLGSVKDIERNVHYNGVNQIANGNKEKRPRRRGKNAKKLPDTNRSENLLTKTFALENACVKKPEKPDKTYSREEIEALRFVDTDAQRNKWIAVYCGLAPQVVKEYDGLTNCDDQKQISFDFDPRQQFGKKKSLGVIGEHHSQGKCNDIDDTTSLTLGYSLGAEDNYDVAAEEFSEEADSDDDYSSIQRPAFSVKGEPNFDSGPPQDGWEYLRRVRWEAAHIPKVKVANIERSKLKKEQTVYMPEIPDIPKCPEHLLPLKEWEDEFLADFAELRKALSRQDDLGSVDSQECFSQLPGSMLIEKFDNLTAADGAEANETLDCSMLDNDASAAPDDISPKPFTDGSSTDNPPTLSAILGMDSVARLSMLRKRIKSADNSSSLSKSDCSWLFALCAAIHTPLDADTCASLRCLLRKTATLRAEKSDLDDEAIMLNILATITGKYFGQSEL